MTMANQEKTTPGSTVLPRAHAEALDALYERAVQADEAFQAARTAFGAAGRMAPGVWLAAPKPEGEAES
jgi:hypothetical protein